MSFVVVLPILAVYIYDLLVAALNYLHICHYYIQCDTPLFESVDSIMLYGEYMEFINLYV